jgi:hypothetical protein
LLARAGPVPALARSRALGSYRGAVTALHRRCLDSGRRYSVGDHIGMAAHNERHRGGGLGVLTGEQAARSATHTVGRLAALRSSCGFETWQMVRRLAQSSMGRGMQKLQAAAWLPAPAGDVQRGVGGVSSSPMSTVMASAGCFHIRTWQRLGHLREEMGILRR